MGGKDGEMYDQQLADALKERDEARAKAHREGCGGGGAIEAALAATLQAV
jgi:hypothetical protein